MRFLEHTPQLDRETAAAIARDHYGLDTTSSPLTSERDQNFLLTTKAGERFVLKIANRLEDRLLLEAQNAAMDRVARETGLAPRLVSAASGESIVEHVAGGGRHFVRLLTWIPGRTLGQVRRHSPALVEDLGRRLGEVDRALGPFDDPALHRNFHWDFVGGIAIVHAHASMIADRGLRRTVEETTGELAAWLEPLLPRLRCSAIHNDANDYNVIVDDSDDVWTRGSVVAGLIDFGDMVHSYTVGELAVAGAYAVLDKVDPLATAVHLVRGYHAAHRLTDEELSALFGLIRLRLCMSVALAAYQHQQRPDDEYLLVSQGPIERTFPRLAAIPRNLAEASFRAAAGLEPVAASVRIAGWLARSTVERPIVPTEPERTLVLDLSVGSPLVAADPAHLSEPAITSAIERTLLEAGATVGIGRYAEPRLLYFTPLFGASDGDSERRTIHLGIDLFARAGTPVRAPIEGIVHAAADNASLLDYGPVIILKHASGDGDEFYTLYGHLSRESLSRVKVGQAIRPGESFAEIGTADVNGGWTPHLHFQVVTDLLGRGTDFPGVCRASELPVWRQLSPDPNAIVRIDGATFPVDAVDSRVARAERRVRLGRNLSIGYRDPIKVARGWKQYLYDATGRRYLDAYNNVPHVGHSHPRVVRAAAEQLAVLNTNTRYLYDALQQYAARLTATLPDPLRVCYFVNSGSEANELALRLARAHTGRRDIIVLDSAYHGNTTTLIDISPYKFNGPGGSGAPAWVHVAPVPDVYRGTYRAGDSDAAASYAADVATIVHALETRPAGSRLCAFIAETCPSVAGQIMLPPGYLGDVYAHVRRAGGVSIADEVQTAYGRIGTHFYAFEAHGVVPDIVVLGKPIGNGYPLGAVITTPEIAASFDNGMEFFSTFGGSTAACAAGLAVLEVVQDEGLQQHALRVGEQLLQGLQALSDRHEWIGDVRGSGFFLGVELVTSRETLEPATEEAAWVVNRLREEGILVGTEGPHGNVLKIRPPMPFDDQDADRLVGTLDRILSESREPSTGH